MARPLVTVPIVDSLGRHTTVRRAVDDKSATKSAGKREVPPPRALPDFASRVTTLTAPRCSSPQHSALGCPLPDCAEGLSRQYAAMMMETQPRIAVQLVQQGVTEPDVARAQAWSGGSWIEWTVPDKNSTATAKVKLPRYRPDFVKAVGEMDKTAPIIADQRGLMRTINSHYVGAVSLVIEKIDNVPVPTLTVADLFIDADLRGLGVGRHVMDSIAAHADENGYIVALSPTEYGDGSLHETRHNIEQRRVRNREHYHRLREFYSSLGFVPSPLYQSFDDGELDNDGTPLVRNQDFIDRAHKNYSIELGDLEMIRFPGGGEPPAAMFIS